MTYLIISILNTNYPTQVYDCFSIELVLYVPSTAVWSNGTTYGNIVTRGQYSGSHGIVRHTPDNTIVMWLRGSTSGMGGAVATITRNTFYHVVGTWDGANVKIYVNGILKQTAALTLVGVLSSADWKIGSVEAMSGSAGNKFNGSIGLVKIYETAIGQAEISQNFNAVRSRFGL